MKVEIIDEYVAYKVLGGRFEDLSAELKKLLSPPEKFIQVTIFNQDKRERKLNE